MRYLTHFIIFSAISGLVAAFLDNWYLKQTCYYGSIDLCNKLQIVDSNWYGFFGSIFYLIVFFLGTILEKKFLI